MEQERIERSNISPRRPWPAPNSAWIYRQSWHHVLFAHWRVEYEQIQSVLPPSLTLDLFVGSPWVSIVAFETRGFRPRGLPAVPGLSNFPEINLRTYVLHDNKPGIYAFSLDTNNLPTVYGARWLFHLNYYRAKMSLRVKNERVWFDHMRKAPAEQTAEFHAQYWPTSEARPTEPGTLAAWLCERYCIYSVDKQQRVYETEINHPAWCLQPAELQLEANTLGQPWGLNLEKMPALVHYSQYQPVIFWPTRSV